MGPLPKSEPKAVAALLLGLSSIACLGAVTGLPAIILGALARKDIDRSRGTLTGSGMAAGGIVTGFFGTGLGFVALLRVAVERHDPELRAMRVETKSAPWFYKLDASALPTDAISADELDTNVETMAPALGRFVRSGPTAR